MKESIKIAVLTWGSVSWIVGGATLAGHPLLSLVASVIGLAGFYSVERLRITHD